MSRFANPYQYCLLALVSALMVVGIANPVFAADAPKTLGAMTNQLYNSVLQIQTFLTMLSYILGVFFSITGLQMLRDYVEEPGRNPAIKPMLRLGAAAFFVFAPTFANLLVNSISGNEVGTTAGLTFSGGSYGAAKGDGLESALVRFVDDFAGPMLDNFLPFISYIAGLIFMLVGLKRLALASGDGPQAPGGMGTLGTFFVGAGLMSLGYIMYTLEGSIFGTTNIINNPVLKDASSSLADNANRTMWGIFIFLRIVGYISVLRGLFMLRAAAEGGNVSMVAVSTHMIAGAMLANGTGFVLAVQKTFIEESNWVLK